METLKFDFRKDIGLKEDYLPCQSCGKMVRVTLHFYGCVFCGDCNDSDGNHTADASEFKPRYEWVER